MSLLSIFAGAAASFRGIGMASLIILLIFVLIQCLTGQTEGDFLLCKPFGSARPQVAGLYLALEFSS